MSWATLADNAIKATQLAFAESTGTYTPDGGSAETPAHGLILSDNSEEVDLSGGSPVFVAATFISARLADLSQTPAQGDGMTAGGTSYLVEEVMLDGEGVVRCKVSEV